MTKQLRFSSLLISFAVSLIALAITFSTTISKSAKVEPHVAIASRNSNVAPFALPAAYGGWLALDIASNNYAIASNQSEINFPGSITIEGWIKSPATRDWADVITKYFSYYLQFTYSPQAHHYCVYFLVNESFHTTFDQPNCSYSINFLSGWHYFAYVYDDKYTHNDKFFWDGYYVGGSDAMSGPGTSTSDLFFRGATAMDEIRISDVARYSENFMPPTAPFLCDDHTRALWHFDETEGATTLHDACGTVDNMFVGNEGAHAEWVTSAWIYLPVISR